MRTTTPSLRVVRLPSVKCGATNRQGQPCGQPAIPGGTVCRFHGGSAPQVRAAAMRRMLTSADDLVAELVRLAKSSESDHVRLGAIRDLLDRMGIGDQRGGAAAGAGQGAPGGGDGDGSVTLPPGELTALLVAALDRTAELAARYWSRAPGSSGVKDALTVDAEVVDPPAQLEPGPGSA